MCMSPMIPTYRYSISSPMPLDLNEDHHSFNHLFNTNQYQPTSSSSSLSYSTLFNPDQDQPGSSYHYWEPNQTQSNEEVGKFIPCKGSWDHEEVEKDGSNISELKVRDLKKEDGNENFEAEDISMKCMPLKMRIKRRMMVDQMGSKNKFEKQKLPISPLGNANSISSNNSSNNSNITVRVCTDCHTTKTPLWRSGPTGPKSLCNACGIRQRKARRALAAAESGNDTILVKENKLQSKGKRSKTEVTPAPLKKKRKHGTKNSRGRNKFSFEDLIISLSENLAPQQAFPQDEKEAAILLMALSYGLLHGFPQIVT